jgi:hypothetical protein
MVGVDQQIEGARLIQQRKKCYLLRGRSSVFVSTYHLNGMIDQWIKSNIKLRAVLINLHWQ